LFTGVLEHLYDPLQELRALRQLLAPTGMLYVYTHNEEPTPDWIPDERISLVHVLYFTDATIRRLLAQAGFSIARLEKRGTSMHVLARPDDPVTTWPVVTPAEVAKLYRRYQYSASSHARWRRRIKRWVSYPIVLARRFAKWLLRVASPTLYSRLLVKRLP
jgi:hypothetical protein